MIKGMVIVRDKVMEYMFKEIVIARDKVVE